MDEPECKGLGKENESLNEKMEEWIRQPKNGLKHTCLFQWRSTKEPIMEREDFVRKVLMGALKLKVVDVFCLQLNPALRGYEVTLHSSEKCLEVEKDFERGKNEDPLILFGFWNIDCLEYRLITVHMYNPHVTPEAVSGFLARYARVEKTVEDCRDMFGIWNGKRQFYCALKKDPGGYDGLAHPPAFFTIGADRGCLYYARQPQFCKKCRGSGHREDTCKGLLRCRICTAEGHQAKDCPAPKACHACGSTGHLSKGCPRRGGAGGGRPGEERTGKEKEAPAEPSKATGETKGGARTGSQAFNGDGVSPVPAEGKKVKKNGKKEELMDTGGSGAVDQAEGEMVAALSFASGVPASLFGPPSPAPSEGTPTWGERVEEEGPK